MTGRIIVEFDENKRPTIVFEGDISFQNLNAMEVDLRFNYSNEYLKSPEKKLYDLEKLRLRKLQEESTKVVEPVIEEIIESEDDNNE